MENNTVVEQQKLVIQLHLGMQEIYNRGAIKNIDSCLIETINTALERFIDLGVCNSMSYDTSTHSKIVYLQCPLANKATVEHYAEVLMNLSLGSNIYGADSSTTGQTGAPGSSLGNYGVTKEAAAAARDRDHKLLIISQEIRKVLALAQGP